MSQIVVEFRGNRVRKSYFNEEADSTMQDSFRHEVSVLQHFAGLGAKFVPHLIDYDDKDLWHETELILGAKPLAHRLVTLPSNQVDAVVTDLIAIDRQLYIHRIDYRAVSIDHILIGENGDAYLTGFARTRINHAHEDILFDSVLGSLAKNFGDSGMAHAFAATLAIRRDEVYRLPIRAARSAVHELIRGHDKRRVEH